MNKMMQIAGQAVLYGAFIAATGYLSAAPSYRLIEPETAMIKISLAHTSQPKGKCVKQTPEQMAKLPPNMRLPVICPRERSPIDIELELNGKLIHSDTIMPSGINHDAAGYTYRKIKVPSGSHRLAVRMRDNIETEGFDYTAEKEVALAPADILVIDFDSKHQEFVFE